jgi:hypothetical protein
VYLDKGDQFPLYLSIDTNIIGIPDKMLKIEAKQKLYFMLTMLESLSDEEIDKLTNNNNKEITEKVESDNMTILENSRIYVSGDASEWALIDDLDGLKRVFDSKGGSLSVGIGMNRNSGISSHLEIKEER